MGDTWLLGWRPYALLCALCLCLYLPGITTIPVTDRDEARFAQATRQMLETGDFLDIRFRDEARNNKPAGIYWLQAVAVGALSTSRSTAIWPYRVPSLIGAAAAAVLTFAFGRTFLGEPRGALIAAVLLASALGTVAEAHLAKTDAALLAATTAGQGALGLAYLRARAGSRAAPGIAALFWLAEIAAIYLKGPIGPGLAVITAATLSAADRDARWLLGLRPALGLIVTALAVAPWLYAIEHATEGQFLEQSVGRDFWSKVMGGQEAHGAWPLYYLGLAFLTFWPGSLYLVPAAITGWLRRAKPAMRYLLAWLIPGWIALELVPTKLPHYVLPLYPALALLAAGSLGVEMPRRLWACGVIGTLLWVLVTLGLASTLIAAPINLDHGVMTAGIVGAVAMVVLAAILLYRRPRPIGTAILIPLLALAFVLPAGSVVIPALDGFWLSRSAAAVVARHPPPEGTTLTVIGYTEPSLVFLLNGGFKSGMGDAPVAAGDQALVGDRLDAAFKANLASRNLVATRIDGVHGYDYSNGQPMTLTLYQIGPK
jgi:4-amino-4-deoxy-L-arabinose transferase-like glycosyltransferase